MNNSNKPKNGVKTGIIITIICAVIGVFVGFFWAMNNGEDFSLDLTGEASKLIICAAAGIISAVTGLIGSISGLVIYRQAKALTEEIKTNEAVFDKAEKKVDLLSVVAGVSMNVQIISFIVALLTYDLTNTSLIYMIFSLVIFLIYIATFIILTSLTQKSYKLSKELSPNLDYNVFDIRIMTTAENQTDEAQRLLIYKAAYKSMGICANTLMAATLVVFVLSLIFGFSYVPTLILGAAAVFLQVVFLIEQYRVNHPKKNKKP